MSSAPGINLRTFYFIAATQTLSILGSTLAGLTVGIWIFAETGEVFPFAIVSIASVLPSILLGSHLGWLADRLDRRLIMATADLGQAATTLLLLLSFVSGAFQLWHLYVLALISATFRFMQQPAFRAAITTLIPPDLRTRANAILEMQSPLAGIVAPALAGVLYAFIGVEGALLADLASFALAFSALLLARFPPQRKSPSNGESIWRQAMAGWRYILASRLVLFTFLYFMFINFLVGGRAQRPDPALPHRADGQRGRDGHPAKFSECGHDHRRRRYQCLPWQTTHAGRAWRHQLRLYILCPARYSARNLQPRSGDVDIWPAHHDDQRALRLAMASQGAAGIAGPLLCGAHATHVNVSAHRLFLHRRVDRQRLRTGGWQRFAPLVGDQPGAGMGLFILLSGLLATVATLALFAFPKLRRFEEHMPDFAVETEAAAPAEATVSQP